MTLEQLRIFVEVAERLHMTQAAEHLNITQSAASASIAALEARHGVRLFNRVGRGLELSQAGALFLGEAKGVLARAEAASGALADLAGLKRGAVRIAASQTIASYWLPERLARFAQLHPSIGLSLIVSNSLHVGRSVAQGDCDLGFVEGEVDEPHLVGRHVGGDRLSLYVGMGHPLAAATVVSVDDLRQASWVWREPGSGTRSVLEGALTARGLDPRILKISLELPSNEAVLGAASSGGLIAGVSALAAAPHEAAGTLRQLPFELTTRRFTCLAHRDRRPSQAVAALLTVL